MKSLLCIAAPIGALTLTSPAAARDYYFFNKPGVDRQTYLDDRLTCDGLAGGVARVATNTDAIDQQIWNNRNLTMGQSAAAAGIATLLIAFLDGGTNRRLQWQVERICLADKGYRRFEMKKADWKAIDETDDLAARIDKWFALASGDKPQGKEMYE